MGVLHNGVFLDFVPNLVNVREHLYDKHYYLMYPIY